MPEGATLWFGLKPQQGYLCTKLAKAEGAVPTARTAALSAGKMSELRRNL